MDHLTAMIGDVRTMVGDLRGDIRDLRKEMNHRFEQADQRFTWLVGTQVATLVAIIAVLVGALYR